MSKTNSKSRLVEFHAQNFRSLRQVDLEDLPAVVLLYGENDTGKSNLIQAIGVWLRIIQSLAKAAPEELSRTDQSADLFEGHGDDWNPDAWVNILGERPDDLFSYDCDRFVLEGELALSLSTGDERHYRFKFQIARSYGGIFNYRVLTALWSGVRKDAPVPFSEPEARELRAALSIPWQQIGAERRFGEEQLPVGASDDWGTALDPTGRGLKLRLFRAAHGFETERRELFNKQFVRLLAGPPFPLPDPTPVVGTDGKIGLLVRDHPVEHRGSGPQQWVLMAGLLAMSQAEIAGLEEPEAHLSFDGQRRVAEALRAMILDQSYSPHQIFVSTHSILMIEMCPTDTVYYKLSIQDSETRVERSRDIEELKARFFTPDPDMKLTPRRLLSANLVRLSDRAIEHLAAEPGEKLFEVREKDGSLRLVTKTQMANYLGESPVEETTK